ncbi:MAG: hypothetical protein GY810_22910 [Aureispira sp.]|nr:hypothetical protein [Aureispira sp.]
MYKYIYSLLLLAISLSACQVQNHLYKTDANYVKTKELKETDESVTTLVGPYKEKLDKEMNAVIGQATTSLTKEQPECTLGNWLADLTLKKCEDYSKTKIDFAVLNQGGIRIPTLVKGDVTRGNIFELMPFDNMLVILEFPGEEMQTLFDHMVFKGGWPISEGVSYSFKDGKATNIKINGRAIDLKKTYKIATNDYIANGGDKCAFFKEKPRTEIGKLFRDAIITHVEELTAANKKVEAPAINRIKPLPKVKTIQINPELTNFLKLFPAKGLPKTWKPDYKNPPKTAAIPKAAVKEFLQKLKNPRNRKVDYFETYLEPFEGVQEGTEKKYYDSTWAYTGEMIANSSNYIAYTTLVRFRSNTSDNMEGEQLLLHTIKPNGKPIHTLPIAQRIFFDLHSNEVHSKIDKNGVITQEVWNYTPKDKDGAPYKKYYQINPDGTIQSIKK